MEVIFSFVVSETDLNLIELIEKYINIYNAN